MTTITRRFCVGDPQGARSSAWAVFWHADKSDVYVVGRQLGDTLRVSLHQSGHCFIRGFGSVVLSDGRTVPKRAAEWQIDPADDFSRPFGILVPNSELQAGAWAPMKSKGTRWLPAPAGGSEMATEIGVMFMRGPPPPAVLYALGWHDTLVRELLPDQRTLLVMHGSAQVPVQKREELEAEKLKARRRIRCRAVGNPRMVIVAGEGAGPWHLIEAGVPTSSWCRWRAKVRQLFGKH